jgi:hypothetical protein
MTLTNRPVLRAGGVYNFGRRDEGLDPIKSLRACLEKFSPWVDLGESVVVLPEAFNVVGEYWVRDRRRLDTSISSALIGISSEFSVALVSGLIEPDGHSAALLIDGDVRKTLSLKMVDDRSGLYRPCSRAEADAIEPQFHRGIWLAALICVDGLEFNPNGPNDRQAVMLRRIAEHQPSVAVLCIPSHSGEYNTIGVAESWPSHLHVLIANSSTRQPSVMRISGERAAGPEYKGKNNKICMAMLE